MIKIIMEAELTDVNSPITPSLLDIIKSQFISSENVAVEPRSLRYAMYVRKSTESEERQVRSIPDQIKDCIELVVKPNNMQFNPNVDIFKEEKSAKEAGTRPEFRRMMQMIEAGKYDGIIAWHYDRLARNMKEAGEIIDLIDRNLIKDLKLAKATFENTPNGKMILGISFVLSKHYSDHLSESVQRGTDSSTERGRILKSQVHGYKITEDKRLMADGDNYLLIQNAFHMRLAGKSLKEIAEYLNSNGYQVYRRKTGHTLRKFDVDMVSKLLKEPVYAGVYAYGKKVIQITATDPQFTPMITEEEYKKLNGDDIKLSYIYGSATRTAPDDVSNFLRKVVICSGCKRFMGTSITTKYPFVNKTKTKKAYFRFICRTKTCPNHGSGPRGSLILDFVLKFLDEHSFSTKSNYARYREDAERALKLKLDKLTSLNKSLTVTLSRKKKEYEDAKKMAADTKSEYAKHFTPQHLDGLWAEVEDNQRQLDAVRSELKQKQGVIKTYDEYVKLFGNTANLLRSTNGLGLSDGIIRIFFSNFTVESTLAPPNYKQKQWSITNHCLCEPFDDFVKNDDFLSWSG